MRVCNFSIVVVLMCLSYAVNAEEMMSIPVPAYAVTADNYQDYQHKDVVVVDVGGQRVMKFNGTTSFVELPALGDMQKGSLTFVAWVNIEEDSDNKDKYGAIIARPGYHTSLCYNFKASLFSFYSFTENKNWVGCVSTTAQRGRWCHVAGVYDITSKTLILYFNGKPSKTTKLTESLILNVNPYYIGCANPSAKANSDMMSGMVGYAKIYTDALSGSDVLSMFNTEKSLYLGR